MNATETIENLLIVFYQMYLEDDMVRKSGIYPNNLIDRSGLFFADINDGLAAINRMRERDWVRIKDPRRKERSISIASTIELTETGIIRAEELINQAEELKKPKIIKFVRELYKDTAEALFRAKLQ